LLAVIKQHFVDFAFVIAGDAISQNVHFVARLAHIEYRRFNTSHGIRTGYKKLVDIIIFDEIQKAVGGQGVALAFYEYVFVYYLQIGGKLGTFRVWLEGSGADRQVVMPYINHMKVIFCRPIDSLINATDYFFIVFCYVVLNVNNDQSLIVHCFLLFLLYALASNLLARANEVLRVQEVFAPPLAADSTA
jgi:hypothetical protein